MPHIKVQAGLPGIRGPMAFSPETAKPLNELVDVLLRSRGNLTGGERELIATYVSSLNDCFYCQTTHGWVAAAHLDGDDELVKQVKHDFKTAEISDRLKALLTIASQVQKGGKSVTEDSVAQARKLGATDEDIHDTVLIAAAFCMFNRYVDGLMTWAPADDGENYRTRAMKIAQDGYSFNNKELMKKS